MSWIALLAMGFFLVLYLRSPIDLVPDRIGLLGLLDDLFILLATVWWVRRRLVTTAGRGRDHLANNQFGFETLDVKKPSELCAPALKHP